MSDIRIKKTSLYLLLLVVAGLALIATYLFGVSRAKPPSAAAIPAIERTRILTGRIVRIDPPRLYLESDDLGETGVFEVVTSRQTWMLRLVPWADGEKEQAQADYERRIRAMNPKNGDVIPPPPQAMKPELLIGDDLRVGDMIGVLSPDQILPGVQVIAKALRPLTDEELRTGSVATAFPY